MAGGRSSSPLFEVLKGRELSGRQPGDASHANPAAPATPAPSGTPPAPASPPVVPDAERPGSAGAGAGVGGGSGQGPDAARSGRPALNGADVRSRGMVGAEGHGAAGAAPDIADGSPEPVEASPGEPTGKPRFRLGVLVPRESVDAGEAGGAGLGVGAAGVTQPLGRLSVPIPTLYAAIGAVAALAIVSYVIGFQLGQADARAEALRNDVPPSDAGLVIDPTIGGLSGTADGAGLVAGARVGSGEVAAIPPGAVVFGTRGVLETDPRTSGRNYLEVATLPLAGAREAVGVLGAGGLNAVAVRVGVERGGRGANNDTRFTVVVLDLGIPSEQFRRTTRERAALEQRVRDIGKRWSASGGPSDFSNPLWRKYER